MSFLLLSLLACPAGGGKDSGDTGGSSNSCTSPTIYAIDGGCNGGTCTWSVDATGEMGSVTFQMDQTGDPAGDCGPGKGGLNACGEWSETHTAFTAAGSGDAGTSCAERKSIDLEVVDSFKNQKDNVSTLFDTNDELGELTVLVTITDSSGNYSDCAVSGDEVSFFADQCSNKL